MKNFVLNTKNMQILLEVVRQNQQLGQIQINHLQGGPEMIKEYQILCLVKYVLLDNQLGLEGGDFIDRSTTLLLRLQDKQEQTET
tara:strand:+ start:146 stop:400 length:255 start_codon:yes stop_codon:yes gene_type:complete